MFDSLAAFDADESIRQEEDQYLLDNWCLQYEQIASAMPYGVWVCGPDGDLRHVSRSFLQLIGMTLEECQQFGWWSKLPKEEADSVRGGWMKCVMAGAPYDEEHQILGQDGKLHWVLVRGVPVRNDLGRITSWVGINLDIEDRKIAERTVVESEKRFRQIADTAPVAIWMTDETGGANYFNRTWLKFTGRSLADQLAGGLSHSQHPDEQERNRRLFHEALAARKPFEMEQRIRRADGIYRHMLSKGTPRFLESGIFVGYIGCSTDITDIRDAMQQVHAANDRFRIAAEALRSFVYDIDLVKNRVVRTVGVTDMLGGDPNNLGSDPAWWLDRIYGDDMRIAQSRLAMGNQPPFTYRVEYRVRADDGQLLTVLDVGRIIHDTEGKAKRMVGTVLDISAQRRAEQTMRLCQERIRALGNLVEQPLFATDELGRIICGNPAYGDLVGDPKTGWIECVDATGRAAALRGWEEGVRSATPIRLATGFGGLDYQVKADPVLDADGTLAGFVGTITRCLKG